VDAVKINLEILKIETELSKVLTYISEKMTSRLGKDPVKATNLDAFEELFTRDFLNKPLVLILDEFEALAETS